nr:hypothetical protein [uncultured Streptomyces sp.]
MVEGGQEVAETSVVDALFSVGARVAAGSVGEDDRVGAAHGCPQRGGVLKVALDQFVTRQLESGSPWVADQGLGAQAVVLGGAYREPPDGAGRTDHQDVGDLLLPGHGEPLGRRDAMR